MQSSAYLQKQKDKEAENIRKEKIRDPESMQTNHHLTVVPEKEFKEKVIEKLIYESSTKISQN